MGQPLTSAPVLHPETWPRWLPGTHLRDLYTHLAESGTGPAACGQPVMWARPGHPTTERRRCPDCLQAAGQ